MLDAQEIKKIADEIENEWSDAHRRAIENVITGTIRLDLAQNTIRSAIKTIRDTAEGSPRDRLNKVLDILEKYKMIE